MTASVVLGLTKVENVQCPALIVTILIMTLAVPTYGGSLGTVCSTPHVSPEPCLPFHGSSDNGEAGGEV